MKKRWVLTAAACALLLGAPIVSRATGETPAPEHRVKAAFIYNFLRFTEWPGASAHLPIRIGVVAPPAIVATIRGELEDRTVGERPIVVERVDREDQVPDKDVLYVSGNDADEARRFVDATAGRPVLTITECQYFTKTGSLINFYLAEDTVHFAVNADRLEHSGVKLSSQMLQYASIVKEGQP